MGIISAEYSLRSASPADAEVIARHRALMFRDMGSIPEGDVEEFFAASVPWLNRLLVTGEYVGWLALWGEEVVAGGGLHLRETGPLPGCYHVGRGGHIGNIYTAPEHRRRGLARLIMTRILEWNEINQLNQLTLTASEEGRPLYQSLGFTCTEDMKLSARRDSR
jgi:GNAT superfamily N-acetyltransferase